MPFERGALGLGLDALLECCAMGYRILVSDPTRRHDPHARTRVCAYASSYRALQPNLSTLRAAWAQSRELHGPLVSLRRATFDLRADADNSASARDAAAVLLSCTDDC